MAKQTKQVVRNRLGELLAIKSRAEERRISERQVARETGLSPITISKWTLNKTDYSSHEVLITLCNYFECGIGDLLYIEEVEIEDDSPEYELAEPA